MQTYFARDDLGNPENWKRYEAEREAFIAKYPDRNKGLAEWRRRKCKPHSG